MKKGILTLDMGGTNIKGCVLTSTLEPLVPPRQTPIRSLGTKEEIIGTLSGMIASLCNEITVEIISISTPGPFRYTDGVSDMVQKYRAINGVDLRNEIRRSCRFSQTMPILFLSDASAYLIGEQRMGAGTGCGQCAAITLGTGLGYAVMEQGKVLVNQNGRPFELLCDAPYQNGVLEDLASGTGVSREYLRRTGIKKTAAELAQIRDEEALKLFQEMGLALGEALAPKMKNHRTDRLIVGGQMAYSFALFEEQLRKCLSSTQVICAKHIPDAALYGAAAYAIDQSMYRRVV